MNAQKLAFFIICFSLAAGIINGSGIFNYEVQNMDIDTSQYNREMVDGITEINGSSSSNDVSAFFEGWAMLSNVLHVLKIVFEGMFMPGSYLKSMGMNALFADAINVVVIITLVFGLIQFVSNRSMKGME